MRSRARLRRGARMAELARALALRELGRLDPVELPLPEIGDDDGLLRVEASGICGSDYHQFRGKLPGVGAVLPVIPGHEIVGRIARVGSAAARRWGVSVGDLVVLEEVLQLPGASAPRVYGLTIPLTEAPGLWGGYSNYVYLHPRAVLHRVPAGVSALDAALFVPIANGIRWGAMVPGTRRGDTVIVLGPGQQGLGCLVGALAAGAERVFITGRARDARRLALARELGATASIDVDACDPVARLRELCGGRGADVVIDASAEAIEPVQHAIELARPGGTVILGGLKNFAAVPLVTDPIALKQLRVQGVGGHDTASVAAALELIASRRFPLEELRSHEFPLARAEHALRVVGREIAGEDPIHVTLIPD
jgi:threonine dehydrogenase-like Zn-dependent dehydrogenase